MNQLFVAFEVALYSVFRHKYFVASYVTLVRRGAVISSCASAIVVELLNQADHASCPSSALLQCCLSILPFAAPAFCACETTVRTLTGFTARIANRPVVCAAFVLGQDLWNRVRNHFFKAVPADQHNKKNSPSLTSPFVIRKKRLIRNGYVFDDLQMRQSLQASNFISAERSKLFNDACSDVGNHGQRRLYLFFALCRDKMPPQWVKTSPKSLMST